MSDYSETTSEGFFSRLASAFMGVLIGIVLFIVSFPLLFWNEGRAVHRAKDLAEGKGNVVSIANPATVDAAAEGKLVHLSAKAETSDVLKDDRFGVEQNAIHLAREAEMYQWMQKEHKETKKKVGGGTETKTTYTYEKTWSKEWIDSSNFKDPKAPQNPGSMPFKSESWWAADVKVGGYKLPANLVKQISGEETMSLTDADLQKVPSDVRSKAKLRDTYLYITGSGGNDNGGDFGDTGSDSSAKVGDVRIQFKRVKPGPEVSVVARQVGSTFEPYTGSSGSSIEKLVMGTKSAAAMFEQMEAENTMMTWLLRIVGYVLMAIGIALCFKPLVVLFDILPFLGDFVSMITGIIGLVVAFPLALITISIAWVAYRPLIGIPLLLVGVGGLVGVVLLVRSRRKPAAAAPPK
jgi:hypothetical protein